MKTAYYCKKNSAEGKTPIDIHKLLKNIYEDATADVSTVRFWVRHCGKTVEGQSSLTDADPSGHPPTAVTP